MKTLKPSDFTPEDIRRIEERKKKRRTQVYGQEGRRYYKNTK